MSALPPLGHPLHLSNLRLTGVYGTARIVAVPLVLGAVAAAGLAAARRTSGRRGKLSLADTRARQGLAAGLCAGAAAALVVSLLGMGTVALLPHDVQPFQWALPGRHLAPDTVYEFDMSVTDSAAGYLLVLVFFPLLGAGLGAWGGLCVAGQPGRRPGGGGGGPRGPEPVPPPPGGFWRPGDDREPALLHGGDLPGFPAGGGPSLAPGDGHAAPRHPEKVTVGAARCAAARRPPGASRTGDMVTAAGGPGRR